MAELFGNTTGARGCFAVYQFDAGASRGAQLILPVSESYGIGSAGAGQLPSASFSQPLMCLGFSTTLRERIMFHKCFGGRIYTYAFGHDPDASGLAISLVGFLASDEGAINALGSDSTSGSAGVGRIFEDVVSQYKDSRLSKTLDTAILVVGDTAPLEGYVVGLDSQTLDSQHSLQQFTIRLSIPELE